MEAWIIEWGMGEREGASIREDLGPAPIWRQILRVCARLWRERRGRVDRPLLDGGDVGKRELEIDEEDLEA